MSKRLSTKPESENYLFSQEYEPDQTVILGRSKLDLFRAFSNNSMVAFIGSGTSVALGYPTWDRFARELMTQVITQCDITLGGKRDDPKYLHSVRLDDTLREYQRLFDGSDPKKKPALFDMIALASEMAAELQRIRSAPGFNDASASNPPQLLSTVPEKPAQEAAGNRTIDETQARTGEKLESIDDFYDRTFRMKDRQDYTALPKGDSTLDRIVCRMQDQLSELAGASGTGSSQQVPMSIPPTT
jgi:hypothetical protein